MTRGGRRDLRCWAGAGPARVRPARPLVFGERPTPTPRSAGGAGLSRFALDRQEGSVAIVSTREASPSLGLVGERTGRARAWRAGPAEPSRSIRHRQASRGRRAASQSARPGSLNAADLPASRPCARVPAGFSVVLARAAWSATSLASSEFGDEVTGAAMPRAVSHRDDRRAAAVAGLGAVGATEAGARRCRERRRDGCGRECNGRGPRSRTPGRDWRLGRGRDAPGRFSRGGMRCAFDGRGLMSAMTLERTTAR